MKVFLIAAISADGYIGRNNTHSADWTGGEDKKKFIQLTKEAGVIIMGSTTFRTIGKALPDRRNIVYTLNPQTITADGVETTDEEPAELLQRLEAEGCQAVAICGGASIYDLFIRGGLVDEVYLTAVPVFFGKGLPLFTGRLNIVLEHIETQTLLDGSVFSHYKVKKSNINE